MMNIYQQIYKRLSDLADLEKIQLGDAIKLKSDGFMDLNIDVLEKVTNIDKVMTEKKIRIAMAHNYIQNGDVMADPDMEIFIYPEVKRAEALTYQQDGLGIYQEVYFEKDGKMLMWPKLKKDLNSFLLQWLKNLEMQGFYKSKG